MCDILAQVPFGFRPFKIADDIRGEVGQMGKAISKGKKGWRKVLQEHGDTRRREERIGYWVDKVVERIDEAQVGEHRIVIDGFRNFAEVQEIRLCLRTPV
ncbi:MAG: hypothetical protein A2Y77_09910 [Planctomycetes bacterium RBG_13_62_9]|nr:MAG: hypothetical protein A2Y77_09910 [Planctomycetes bacterium RBG_13_62_9]